MSKVSLTIDSNQVEVDPGTTILEAAESLGIDIPTLCHHPELKPFGSCFLCVVQIEGRPNLMPSCSTPVMEGMNVTTMNEDIRGARKMCLELLLSDHVGDCVGPCVNECPCHVDIPGFLNYLTQKDFESAEALIKQSMPIPGSLGRVCPRPCEGACRRNNLDAPIAICNLKRFAVDPTLGSDHMYRPEQEPESGKSVGIIGAGPAGIAAAYFLRIHGHGATVYEMYDKPGGMMRWGIPAFRLPRDVIDNEVGVVEQMGAEFRYNTTIGKDITFEELREKHDAVFIGIGAQRASKLRCEGEDLEGVLSALDFLYEASAGERTTVGNRVMVVGGGNTAVDAARTAVRLGADKVFILYRRSRDEMPAFDYEIAEAEEEGVEIQILAAPAKVEKAGDGLAVHCIKMELGEPDDSGRRRPVPMEGSEYIIEVDNVIAAIGQGVDAGCLGDSGLEMSRWGTPVIDERTCRTNLPDVFAGGDAVLGPDIAVRASAMGRLAAVSIDQYFKGEKVTGDPRIYNSNMGSWRDLPRDIFGDTEPHDREEMPLIEMEERRHSFHEVEKGFTVEAGLEEAGRCLACGCRAVNTCTLRLLTDEYGVDPMRFFGDHRDFEVDDSHPDILFEPGKCILCGICVRMCDEVLKVPALGFVGRGFGTSIAPPLKHSLADVDFEGIVKIVDSCPTGAFTLKTAPVASLKIIRNAVKLPVHS
jgi:formate dehydrogenase major subunit